MKQESARQRKHLVPLSKQSEKQRRAFYAARRNTWDCNPVTRVRPSGKVYDRKKERKMLRDWE